MGSAKAAKAYRPEVQHEQHDHNDVVSHEAIAEEAANDVNHDCCHLQMTRQSALGQSISWHRLLMKTHRASHHNET